MKKLTLVSFMCRRCIVTAFLKLPIFDGKAVIHSSTIDRLFQEQFGFTPQR
jgi:hypothetical protein